MQAVLFFEWKLVLQHWTEQLGRCSILKLKFLNDILAAEHGGTNLWRPSEPRNDLQSRWRDKQAWHQQRQSIIKSFASRQICFLLYLISYGCLPFVFTRPHCHKSIWEYAQTILSLSMLKACFVCQATWIWKICGMYTH